MRRFSKNRIAAALFIGLLFLPLGAHILLGGATVSMVERRALAPFPTLDDVIAAPATLPDKLSRWMEDHMGLRSALTKLYAKLQDELHLEDKRFAVRGGDGWLFLAIDQALASHQGLHPFAPGEAQNWIEEAKRIEETACEKPFAVLIAPDKHTIYPEKLSRYPRLNNRATRLETLSAIAHESGIALAAPTNALLNAKEDAPVYYRTDSHWTARGAYEGYLSLIMMLKEQGLPVDQIDLSRLEQKGERKAPNDIYGLIGVENPASEMTPNWRIRSAAKILQEEHLSAYDWNGVEAKRWVSSKHDAPRLFVYGDSFFYALQPFLAESFSSVTFVHHRAGEPPLSALQSCDYDAVILQMVERHLNTPLAPAP